MWRPAIWTAAVLATIVWSSPVLAQANLVGEWVAKQKIDDNEVELRLLLKRAGEDWTGSISDPTGTGAELPMSALRVGDESVSFNSQPESIPYPASFYGNYDAEDDMILGTFSVGGRSLPMSKFRRADSAEVVAEEEKKPRVQKHFYNFAASGRLSFWFPIRIIEDNQRNINDVTSSTLNWDVSARWYALDALALFGRYLHGGLGFDSDAAQVEEFAYMGLTTDSYLKLDGWEFGLNAYVGPALLPNSRFNPYFTGSLGRTSWEVTGSGRGSEVLALEDVPLQAVSTAFGLGLGTEYAINRRLFLEAEWTWRFVLSKDETQWPNSDLEWTNTSLWTLSFGLGYAF
jgi:opacity protein-like surface antigen